MKTPTMFTKKTLLSLLLGLLLGSSLMQAQKRPIDDVEKTSNGEGSNSSQTNEGASRGAAATPLTESHGASGSETNAQARGAAAPDEKPPKNRSAGGIFSCVSRAYNALKASLGWATAAKQKAAAAIKPVPNNQGPAAPMPVDSKSSTTRVSAQVPAIQLSFANTPETISIIEDLFPDQPIITHEQSDEGFCAADSYFICVNANQITITLPLDFCRFISNSFDEGIQHKLQEAMCAVITHLQSEKSPLDRFTAYQLAQQFRSTMSLHARLFFAAMADYLAAPFLAIMAWYSFTPEEQAEHLCSISFYDWERAFATNSPEATTQEDEDYHLATPTGDRAYDTNLGLSLLAYTGNDCGFLPANHEEDLRFLQTSSELSEGKNTQERAQQLLQGTRLSISSIEYKEFFDIFFAYLDALPSLATLDFSYNSLSQLDAKYLQAVFNCLTRMPRLTTLNLSGNDFFNLDTQRLQIIFNCLPKMPRLKTLHLSKSTFGRLAAERLQIVFDCLVRMQHLTTLNLSLSTFGILDTPRLQIVFNNLPRIPDLTTLDLRANFFSPLNEEQLQIVFDGLTRMPRLEELNLAHNRLPDAFIQRLREALPNTNVIVE